LTTPTTFRLPLESLKEGEAFVVTFSAESFAVVVVVVDALAIKLVPIKKEEGETTNTKERRRDIASDIAIMTIRITTTHILSLSMCV
jgi:hypothetical protein